MSEISTRRFCVHGVAEGGQRTLVVEASGFEDAALAFVEDQHPVAGADEDVVFYVEDLDSGQRHCFRIDLSTGETAPCD